MSVFSSIAGGLAGLGQSAINYDAQIQNLNYQKDLQKQIFAREDNAVQRRAEDLEKAGLSKTLAAGDAAGAGAIVNTKAPQTSVLDDVLRGMSVSQMQADVKYTQAQTENLMKQNEEIDSRIESQVVDRNYTLIKMAIERGNLDMLPITKAQKEASLSLTHKQIELADEQIRASMQNRSINDYKLSVLLPQQFEKNVQEIANLKKHGLLYDADVAYRNLQSDLLVYNINEALFSSRIKELDYYYQSSTGLKPRSASPGLGDIMAATNSGGYKKYLDWVVGLGKSAVDGYTKIIESFKNKKDKTPY